MRIRQREADNNLIGIRERSTEKDGYAPLTIALEPGNPSETERTQSVFNSPLFQQR